jgi:hypothetical protein
MRHGPSDAPKGKTSREFYAEEIRFMEKRRSRREKMDQDNPADVAARSAP